LTDDSPITRRESEMRWKAHADLHDAHDKAHDQEHEMTEQALDKAVNSMDRRLEGMNEFRNTLRDQAATFVRMETYQALVDRVINIEKNDKVGEGKSLGQGTVIAAIVVGLTITGTIISLVVVIANLLSATP
jgi:arginine utilization protein RocB